MRGLEPRCDVLAKSKPTNVIVWVRHVRSLQEIRFLCNASTWPFTSRLSHRTLANLISTTAPTTVPQQPPCSLCEAVVVLCTRVTAPAASRISHLPPLRRLGLGARQWGHMVMVSSPAHMLGHVRGVVASCADTCLGDWELGPASFQSVLLEKLRLIRFRRLIK